jgi:hypothetical protein
VITDASAAQLEKVFRLMAQDTTKLSCESFRPAGSWSNSPVYCCPKTMERVVVQLISDMQCEYSSALGEKRDATPDWIRIRGYAGFWQLVR